MRCRSRVIQSRSDFLSCMPVRLLTKHLETPHFKKYKTETAGMVKSLTLVETEPILLGTKFK